MGPEASNNAQIQRNYPNIYIPESTDSCCALVACVAGAVDFGVACHANLYLIKFENFFVNTVTGDRISPGAEAMAILEATRKVLVAIGDEVPKGRAVFNMASGL